MIHLKTAYVTTKSAVYEDCNESLSTGQDLKKIKSEIEFVPTL